MSEDAFARHRSLLFTVAYEMLGSASDAEDVVQETWLRWAAVGHAEVRDPRAYLARIVTRQALNRLRSLARRREDYVGEWLPEPVLTGPDVAADVEFAESLSIAMLTVLESLGPAERAVFVLREVFDIPYDEIAEAVGKSPAASARSPTGLATTSRLGGRGCRSARPSSKRPWTGSSPRSDTATCKGSSTSLHPTSSPSATEAAWHPLLVVRSRVRNAWPAC
jgi:RNA polymerase sigma factor (sigma-70 family)